MRTFSFVVMFFALLCVLAIATTPVISQDKKKDKVDPAGEPKGFKPGDVDRYAVWHDKKGWHLRTTTAKVKHHFQGSITVDGGTIEAAHSLRLEKEGKLADHWRLDMPGRQKLAFDFKTDEGVDGIDFKVSASAKTIHFNLLIDGKHQAKKILIGQDNDHPAQDPFTLPAHPGKKKKDKND